MSFLRSVLMAFSMFTKIPVPQQEWTDRNMRYIMAGLPFVGVVIGLLLWGWSALCDYLQLGELLYAAGLTLIPVAVTGGIHLDGFADTVDAMASHASPEKKQEILKDPRAGAFAVIALIVYFLLYAALCSELAAVWQTALLLGLIHCIARGVGGLAALTLPAASWGGLQDTFRRSARKGTIIILAIELAVFSGGILWFSPLLGAIALLAAGFSFLHVARMATRQFGGMNGDLAGYLIRVGELAMLASAVLCAKLSSGL